MAAALEMTSFNSLPRNIRGEDRRASAQRRRRRGGGRVQLLCDGETGSDHPVGILACRRRPRPTTDRHGNKRGPHVHQQQQHHSAGACGLGRTCGLSAEQRREGAKAGEDPFYFTRWE